VCENAVDEDALRFAFCVPNNPLRRVFVTPGSTRQNYFSACDRRRDELSVAFCSYAQHQKKRLPAMLVTTAGTAVEFLLLRLIARIQRNTALFCNFSEICNGRIDVHDMQGYLAGRP
jgi:hypothetical protein